MKKNIKSFVLPKAKLNIFADAQQVTKALADNFCELANAAITNHGRFSVALSGGNTPKALYAKLAGKEYAGKVDWTHVYLFWSDERCVPHDSPDSNFGMVKDAMLDQINIPEENIIATKFQNEHPKKAAEYYQKQLSDFFKLKSGILPNFDLILLGLGPDGHCASLFPETSAVWEKELLVAPVYVKKFDSWRITFTLPVINAAKNVWFMVCGQEKDKILAEVIEGPNLYPSQLVWPTSGSLQWFVDEAAASKLNYELLQYAHV
jgi:6-phosphogluconolactonase